MKIGNNKKLISIIAPMYNEQELVKAYGNAVLEIITKENEYDFEILLVDDGSKDQTLDQMLLFQKEYPALVGVITLTRNFGLEGAVYAGLQKAKGDAAIVMDADLQDPPSLIPAMVQKWEDGSDIIIAKRSKRIHDSWFKRFTAKIYYGLLEKLSERFKLEKHAANFRLLDRKAVDLLLSMKEVNGVFRISSSFIGMKTAVVEYERDKRYAGETKYKLNSMIRYGLDSVTGVSVAPLRKLFLLPIISAIFILIFAIWSIINPTIFFEVGLMGILVSILFTLLFIGVLIIAEYIAQIMIEVKGRPISIIYEYYQPEK